MFWLILGILLFFGLVLIHEFGHFLAAKKSGVKVLEFGIGIPPKLFTFYKDRSGTKYTFNLLPFGGFVRLKGEDPSKPDEFNARDSFIQAKLHKKIIILLAGVFMNFIGARVLFTTVFTLGTRPISILPENAVVEDVNSYLMPTFSFLEREWLLSGEIVYSPAKVIDVFDGALGEEAKLMSWDTVLSINDVEVNSRTIGKELKKNIWQPIVLTYQRGDDILTKDLICPEDQCLLWVSLQTDSNLDVVEIKFPLKTSIVMWLQEIWAQTKLTMWALGRLWKSIVSFNKDKISGSLNKLTGPAWAIKFGENLLNYGGRKLYLAFAGMISLALAIFNVLPIPALDGGRLLWVLIQKIFRLKPEKYFNVESYINIVFFILLLWLWVYILLKEILGWRGTQHLRPFFLL